MTCNGQRPGAADSINGNNAPSTKGEPSLRIMTFDVRNERQDADQNSWDYRGVLVTKLVENYAPDVVDLQESSGGFQIEDLNTDIEGLPLVNLSGHRQGRRNAVLFREDRLSVAETCTFCLSDTPNEFTATWGNIYPQGVKLGPVCRQEQ